MTDREDPAQELSSACARRDYWMAEKQAAHTRGNRAAEDDAARFVREYEEVIRMLQRQIAFRPH
jgi:hypothetical protein